MQVGAETIKEVGRRSSRVNWTLEDLVCMKREIKEYFRTEWLTEQDLRLYEWDLSLRSELCDLGLLHDLKYVQTRNGYMLSQKGENIVVCFEFAVETNLLIYCKKYDFRLNHPQWIKHVKCLVNLTRAMRENKNPFYF